MNQKLAAREMLKKLIDNHGWLLHPPEQSEGGTSRSHTHWMLLQIINGNMSPSKEGRWLGWVQALTTLWGMFSLEELKSLNKACSCEDEGCPHFGSLHIHIDCSTVTPEQVERLKRGTYAGFSVGYNTERNAIPDDSSGVRDSHT